MRIWKCRMFEIMRLNNQSMSSWVDQEVWASDRQCPGVPPVHNWSGRPSSRISSRIKMDGQTDYDIGKISRNEQDYLNDERHYLKDEKTKWNIKWWNRTMQIHSMMTVAKQERLCDANPRIPHIRWCWRRSEWCGAMRILRLLTYDDTEGEVSDAKQSRPMRW